MGTAVQHQNTKQDMHSRHVVSTEGEGEWGSVAILAQAKAMLLASEPRTLVRNKPHTRRALIKNARIKLYTMNFEPTIVRL